jgi:hypothetical protein
VEVEAGAGTVRLAPHSLRRVLVLEPARGVRLVRRLVLREADVAINAENRTFGISDELRRELAEPHIDFLDEQLEGGENFTLVRLLVRLEPVPLVVALELPQERECAAAEAAKNLGHTGISASGALFGADGLRGYTARNDLERPLRVVRREGDDVEDGQLA